MNDKAIFRYQAFGLRIDSELELPELLPAAGGSADATVRYGDLSDKIPPVIGGEEFFYIRDNEFVFRAEGVGNFLVDRGTAMTVHLFAGADMKTVRLLLLGLGLGMLLSQRGVTTIHGSAVALDGQAVLLIGPPGAGKSTMNAALCRQGWSFLADDIAAITAGEDGVLRVHPGIPSQKLTGESAAMVGVETAGLEIIPDKNKFLVPADNYLNRPLPVAAIYEIVAGPGETSSVTPLAGMAKVETLVTNSYSCLLLGTSGRKTTNFNQCVDLARQAAVCRLTRPESAGSIAGQLASFCEHFRNHTVSGHQPR